MKNYPHNVKFLITCLLRVNRGQMNHLFSIANCYTYGSIETKSVNVMFINSLPMFYTKIATTKSVSKYKENKKLFLVQVTRKWPG